MKKLGFYFVLLFVGCSLPEPMPESMALKETPPLPPYLEYRGTDEQSLATIRQSIADFERKTQQRECHAIQFAGYDSQELEGPKAPLKSGKFKAVALSTCGPHYYWFQQDEQSGHLSKLEISARNPAMGDRMLVPGTYGKWELGYKRGLKSH